MGKNTPFLLIAGIAYARDPELKEPSPHWTPAASLLSFARAAQNKHSSSGSARPPFSVSVLASLFAPTPCDGSLCCHFLFLGSWTSSGRENHPGHIHVQPGPHASRQYALLVAGPPGRRPGSAEEHAIRRQPCGSKPQEPPRRFPG